MVVMADDDLTAELDRIAERAGFEGACTADPIGSRSCDDARVLIGAIRAVLELADDLTRKSEALDAEAEYVAAEHPEAAAVAVLKRERSIVYDECARWFREAITREITGKEESE